MSGILKVHNYLFNFILNTNQTFTLKLSTYGKITFVIPNFQKITLYPYLECHFLKIIYNKCNFVILSIYLKKKNPILIV